METNTNTPEAKQPASAGCHPTTCSALSDLLGNLDEWAIHYRELGSPVTLSILRARKMLADQADRIGELFAALNSPVKWRDPETDPPTKTGKILIWIEGIGPSVVNVEERWMCYWNGNDETEPTCPQDWDWWAEISPPNREL